MFLNFLLLPVIFFSLTTFSQNPAPPQVDLRLYDIIDAVSANRIEADIFLDVRI